MHFLKIKGILFDLDGVLFNSIPLWEESLDETFKQFYNIVPDPEFTKSIIARTNPGILRCLIKEYIPECENIEKEISKTNDFLEKYFLEHMTKKIELFQEVEYVLSELRLKEIPLVVLTNAPKIIVTKIIEEKKALTSVFTHVLTFDDVMKGKPDPEMIYKALELLQVSASDVYFIGDSLNSDGGASKAANVPFIFIDRKIEKTTKIDGYIVINSLTEIFSLIS